MKDVVGRYVRLFTGYFVISLGFVFMLNANVGYAPWDVFQVGISKTLGLTVGTVSIIVGVVVGIIAAILGEKIGIGTIGNMIFIGIFLDLILGWGIVPKGNSIILGIVILIVGLFILAFGVYLYIGAGYGTGPRDGLMVVFSRLSGLSLAISRAIIEGIAVIIGWFLGGRVGIGTVIAALFTGFVMELVCKFMNFDIKKVEHQTLDKIFISKNKNKSISKGNNL